MDAELKDAQTILADAITEEASSANIYFAVASQVNLGAKSKSSASFRLPQRNFVTAILFSEKPSWYKRTTCLLVSLRVELRSASSVHWKSS